MWSSEYSRTTSAGPWTVMAILSDTRSWPEWNAGVEWVTLDGPFVAGTRGSMKVPGEEPLAFRLIWVDPERGFEDETPLPEAGIVVRVRHAIERMPDGGTRITYRATIDGPAADEAGPTIGPAISGDFPDVLAALTARAEAIEAGATALERSTTADRPTADVPSEAA